VTPARTAVVTGASAGIGKATAVALARMGWRVIGVGRDPARSAAAEAEIRAAAASRARVDFVRADFTLMSEVLRASREIAALTSNIDVLINNAGGVRDRLVVTAEGTEATFAANHLAPFLLTRELLPVLRATARSRPPGTVRVIGVSSSGHAFCAGMNWDDLNLLGNFSTAAAYCQAKLANVLFTRELSRRAAADGIVAQCMHPGVVDSNFMAHADELMRAYMRSQDPKPPEHAARTLVFLATSPEAGRGGGRYFHDGEEAAPAPQALDDAAARRLWEASEVLLARLRSLPQA
jgi:NAD(P)-dependent dehydrogenase (short-subunit alcohol dehydrogenase family)